MTLVPKKEQIESMLAMQTVFNVKIDPNWKTAGYAYADAIWTEAAEAFDHTKWPWWKKSGQTPDIPQIKMELIDIWHFVMSELMVHETSEDLSYSELILLISEKLESLKSEENLMKPGDIESIKGAFRMIVASAVMPAHENRILDIISSFVQAMYTLEMTWDEVYKLYIGKNTLNGFRQVNGYKKETEKYVGVWAAEKGWEDNEYLTELLEGIDASKPVDEIQVEITGNLTEIFKRNEILQEC